MKNWTCYILSFALVVAASLPNAKAYTNNVLSYFLGIEPENSSQQVFVDFKREEVSDEMKIEIENIKKQIQIEKNETYTKERPTVLIYHTHTDEAFYKGDEDYVETSAGRTKNQDYSVVAVGAKLKEELEKYGFTVIHDKTDNVSAGFNKAYQTSYETIQPYIGKVDVFIDLHRDAYYGQNPNGVIVGDKKAAKVCFVVANGENYTYKPNWQENYKLAQKLTDTLNEICPKICDEVIFKNSRFNQHVSTSCLLIEFGNEKNTLEEVKESAVVMAQAINILFS